MNRILASINIPEKETKTKSISRATKRSKSLDPSQVKALVVASAQP
jgi:hypothetical protein